MKRLLGFLLILVGISATAAGAVVGCTSVFGWNGRHPIASYDLEIGKPLRETFPAKRGRRYAAGVQVVFEREGLAERDGQLIVEAHMPLMAAIRDADGNKPAQVVGWLDPNEPPTVLFGHLAQDRAHPEVMAERIIGPFPCPREEPLSVEVDLGPDRAPDGDAASRTGSRIAKTRVVVYDDAYPTKVALAFGVAGVGMMASLTGVVMLMAGFFRNRRGIRARAMSSYLPKRLSTAVLAALVATAVAPSALAQQTTPKTTDAKKKDDKKEADKKAAADKEKKAEKKSATDQDAKVEEKKTDVAPPEEPAKEAKRAVYLVIDGALVHSDIGGLSNNLSIDKTGANGESYSLGGGVRWGALQVGAKFHGFSTTQYQFWSVLAEIGYGLNLRPFEPIFLAHAGYIWSVELERDAISTSLPPGNFLAPEVDMRGALLGVEAYGAYWINSVIHLGPFVGADFTFLHRDRTALPTSVLPGAIPDDIRAKPLYTDSGSGVGYVINLGIRGSLDLAF